MTVVYDTNNLGWLKRQRCKLRKEIQSISDKIKELRQKDLEQRIKDLSGHWERVKYPKWPWQKYQVRQLIGKNYSSSLINLCINLVPGIDWQKAFSDVLIQKYKCYYYDIFISNRYLYISFSYKKDFDKFCRKMGVKNEQN